MSIDTLDTPSALLDALRPRVTGSWLVTFEDPASPRKGIDALQRHVGGDLAIATAEASVTAQPGTATIFEDIGVAILTPKPEQQTMAQMTALNRDEDILEARPEIYMFMTQEFRDTEIATWGVSACLADVSEHTGRGIKVAILDTGIDQQHPDFAGRRIVAKSFVDGETTDDIQGHGTHCAGTAVGRAAVAAIPRYGMAPDADLYVGKVLNNSGFGAERDIIAGMRWAIAEKCEVISMSLGSPVRPGERFLAPYERQGRIALENGCLICAAAGNESNRAFGIISPVGSPANAPSILAVAAVDPLFQPAAFSNGGINPDGGEIGIAAPGTGIFSSSPTPRLYRVMDGTSMACPHVAGIAALWAESDIKLRGRALWDALIDNARQLQPNARDVGAGLVQAPTTSRLS